MDTGITFGAGDDGEMRTRMVPGPLGRGAGEACRLFTSDAALGGAGAAARLARSALDTGVAVYWGNRSGFEAPNSCNLLLTSFKLAAILPREVHAMARQKITANA